MAGLFFSTVEASADLHAAHVAKAIRRLAPDAPLYAAGGDRLREAGVDVLLDTQGHAAMGLLEVVRHVRYFTGLANDTADAIEDCRPDAVVLVDASGYHLRLARRLRAEYPKLPILYYIPPKLWAWNPDRVATIQRCITQTLCIFPFEEQWFREHGVDAVYVGNPTLDQLRPHIARREEWIRAGDRPDRGRFFSPWHTGSERTVAVFPGSRKAEVLRLWPVFTQVIRALQAEFIDLLFTVALAPGLDAFDLRCHAPIPPRTAFVESEWSQRLLAGSVLMLAKSGTCTLEAGLLGVPMTVAYRVNPVTAYIARHTVLRGRKYFSLPNILAQREIVPELIQGDATAENIASVAADLLADPVAYSRMRADLLALRDTFGDIPAAERTARAMLAHVNR